MATITAANCKLTFTVRSPQGIPVLGPHTLAGYASDDAFAGETMDVGVAVMGVDGRKSGAYVPTLRVQNIILQADSESVRFFEDWQGLREALGDDFVADGVLVQPGLGKSYALVNGTLTRFTPFAQAKSTLQPLNYAITWEKSQPAPVVV